MMTKKFVQFHFKNVDESKKIACLIALLTCNYLKGSTQFIHLMTASQLSSLGGVIKVQHQLYKLNDIDPAFFMRNVSEENSHDGFINKKLDPYKTQLRSRPRHNAKDKDH